MKSSSSQEPQGLSVGQQPAAFSDVGSVMGMFFSPVSGPLAGQASDGQEE